MPMAGKNIDSVLAELENLVQVMRQEIGIPRQIHAFRMFREDEADLNEAMGRMQEATDEVAAAISSFKKARQEKKTRKKKEPGVLTVAEKKLINLSAQISSPPLGDDMAFTHSVFCQVGLPRSKHEGQEFIRQSGDAWLSVQAGWLDEGSGPIRQVIPYGPLPRLALAWISTEAIKTKNREIEIGDSASEFLRRLGKPLTGGARGSFTNLRRQMHGLAACRLQLGFRGRTFNGQPVEQFDAWTANRDTGQKALWPGVLVLSETYFQSLAESAVPLDQRSLLALSDSALALDVYAWLAHRLHRIDGKGLMLYWHSLKEQFGQENTGKNGTETFKESFLIQLKKVLMVYPKAQVKQVNGGIYLKPSPPPISFKNL